MRLLNRALRALIALAAVLPLFPAAAAAQDAPPAEPAATSRLTGVALPAGALRVTDAKMRDELATALRTVAAEGGFALGQTEALLWGGPAHTETRNKELKDALIQTLRKAGYNYESAGEMDIQNGRATLFLAGKPNAKQATMGLFIANKSYLALAWGAVTPKEAAKTDAKADPPAAKTDSAKTDSAKTDSAKTDSAKADAPAGKGVVPADLVGNWMWTTISSVNYRDTFTNQLLEPSGMAVRMSFTKNGRYTFFFYIRQRTYNLVTAATTTHEGTVVFGEDGTFTLRPEKGHYKGSTGSRIVDRDMTAEERKPTVYHWEWRTEDNKRQLYMGPSRTSLSLFKPGE